MSALPLFFSSALLVFVLSSGSLAATDREELDGKALFHYDRWPGSERSCASCHPGGKGLEKISDFDDAMLADLVNACLRDAVKTSMLSEDAPELDRLVRYLRTLEP